MMMLILGVVVVIAFALGLAMIFRGFLGTPDADKVVNVDEFNKLNSTLSESRQQEETLKLQLDSLTLDLQNSRTRVTQLEKTSGQFAELKTQKQRLDDRVSQLARDLEFITGKADQQAREAIEVLEDLKQRNNNLSQSIEDFQSRAASVDPQELETLRKDKEDLQGRLDQQIGELKKVETALEEEKRSISARHEESRGELDRLTTENRDLLQGLKSILEKIKEAQGAAVKAKDARAAALKSDNAAMSQLKAEKEKLAQELTAARIAPSASAVVSPPPSRPAGESGEQVEDLLNQVRSLRARIDENDRTIQFFQQKEKVMEEDLTRARAQAMGLSKICEEFKSELDKSEKA